MIHSLFNFFFSNNTLCFTPLLDIFYMFLLFRLMFYFLVFAVSLDVFFILRLYEMVDLRA